MNLNVKFSHYDLVFLKNTTYKILKYSLTYFFSFFYFFYFFLSILYFIKEIKYENTFLFRFLYCFSLLFVFIFKKKIFNYSSFFTFCFYIFKKYFAFLFSKISFNVNNSCLFLYSKNKFVISFLMKMPTKRFLFSVLRSPFVHKKSIEQYGFHIKKIWFQFSFLGFNGNFNTWLNFLHNTLLSSNLLLKRSIGLSFFIKKYKLFHYN